MRVAGGVATLLDYDGANRLMRLRRGSETICRHAYDGDGARTKRLDQNGTIHYIGDLYERNVGYGAPAQSIETRYYYATLGSERRLLGFRTAGALTLVGTDHLGSTIATAAGEPGLAITGRLRYTPYGEGRGSSGNFGTDRGFTGQTADAISGMYWYRSRYYDPAIGRFVQPDTVVPGASNPQAWNRYAYALNNPVTRTDPSGHASIIGADPGASTRITTRPEAVTSTPITTIPEVMPVGPNVTILPPSASGPNITVIDPGESGPRIFTDGGLGQRQTIYSADERITWPQSPREMDEMLEIPGIPIPDLPGTPGRGKVQWEPNGEKVGVRVTFEQHPYDAGYGPDPTRHTGPHWHLDNRAAPKDKSQQHQTFVADEPIPGDVVRIPSDEVR